MEAHVAAAYATLGLGPGATDRDVKEAYRRLVLLHHPDRAPADRRAQAEQAFLRVRSAYDSLLSRAAGYSPPPPGSGPSAAHAEAWWHAHGAADGRVPWGRYNGYETEKAFYAAMARSGRSSLLWLSAAGLLGVPVITALSMAAQSLRQGGGGKHRRRDAAGEARGWGVTAGGLAAAGDGDGAAAAAAATRAAGRGGAPAAGGPAPAQTTAATAPGGAGGLARGRGTDAREQEEQEEEEEDTGGVAVLGLDTFRAQMRVNGGVALSSPFAATTALDRHALRERLGRERRERERRRLLEAEGEGQMGEGRKRGEDGAGGAKKAAGAAAAAR